MAKSRPAKPGSSVEGDASPLIYCMDLAEEVCAQAGRTPGDYRHVRLGTLTLKVVWGAKVAISHPSHFSGRLRETRLTLYLCNACRGTGVMRRSSTAGEYPSVHGVGHAL